MALWSLFIAVAVSVIKGEELTPQRFCEAYVQCTAVATLEERICIGNWMNRPYWLPSKRDPNFCHEALKSDYAQIENLEKQLEEQLTVCLRQYSRPFTDEEKRSCGYSALRSALRFSFGRCITYVPTNCFTGTKKRIERECSKVKECCLSLPSCTSVARNSQLAIQIQELRSNLLRKASDCEKNAPIDRASAPSPCEEIPSVITAGEGQEGSETTTEKGETPAETVAPSEMESSGAEQQTVVPSGEESSGIEDNATTPKGEGEPTGTHEETVAPSEVESSGVEDKTVAPSAVESSRAEETTVAPSEIGSSGIQETTTAQNDMEASRIEETTVAPSEVESSGSEETTTAQNDMEASRVEETTVATSEIESSGIEQTTTTQNGMEPSGIEETTVAQSDMESNRNEEATVAENDLESSRIEETTITQNDMEPSGVNDNVQRK